MKPACPKCKLFYRPKKNGYVFQEMMPIHNDAKPGLLEEENWRSYKIWSGDLWECRGCNNEIIVGTGFNPMSEHYHPDYKRDLPLVQVNINDC